MSQISQSNTMLPRFKTVINIWTVDVSLVDCGDKFIKFQISSYAYDDLHFQVTVKDSEIGRYFQNMVKYSFEEFFNELEKNKEKNIDLDFRVPENQNGKLILKVNFMGQVKELEFALEKCEAVKQPQSRSQISRVRSSDLTFSKIMNDLSFIRKSSPKKDKEEQSDDEKYMKLIEQNNKLKQQNTTLVQKINQLQAYIQALHLKLLKYSEENKELIFMSSLKEEQLMRKVQSQQQSKAKVEIKIKKTTSVISQPNINNDQQPQIKDQDNNASQEEALYSQLRFQPPKLIERSINDIEIQKRNQLFTDDYTTLKPADESRFFNEKTFNGKKNELKLGNFMLKTNKDIDDFFEFDWRLIKELVIDVNNNGDYFFKKFTKRSWPLLTSISACYNDLYEIPHLQDFTLLYPELKVMDLRCNPLNEKTRKILLKMNFQRKINTIVT